MNQPLGKQPLVVAITGASGAVYAIRLLEVLQATGIDVQLLISPSGKEVLKAELGIEVDLDNFAPASLLPAKDSANAASNSGQIVYQHYNNFLAPIASGSFLTSGMVICPCSGSTLSGIAHGASTNLIQREADVHLKEHRRLILVPRETPLSVIQLDNMRAAAAAGAVVLPAMPGWYHGVRSVQDLIDFVVARILDQLNIEHQLIRRWGDA